MTNEFTPNDAQRKAIEFGMDHPLKVIAGAGTGKTAVLTQRFVHIVKSHRIPPYRILALTFTKKAAAEMQSRIAKALLENRLIRRSEVPLLLWVGNFHSICLRLLKLGALTVGLDPSFAVIEEAHQRLLLSEVVDDFLNKRLATETDVDTFEDLMVDDPETFTQTMLAVVNQLKSRFITPEGLRQTVEPVVAQQYQVIREALSKTAVNEELHPSARKAAQKRLASLPAAQKHERLLLDAVYEICKAYKERLEAHDLVDFNDLIMYAYRLVRSDPHIKKRFQYVLVDEFQDTDYGQYQLLKELTDNLNNVTVVADAKQSIYEWRDARPENIEDFPGEVITLDENYRSYGEILDSANFLISQSMPAERPLRPATKGGRGRANTPQVTLFRADTREAEAHYVAGEICRLLAGGTYSPSEVTLLMRSVHASQPYEDALRTLGISYATVGGLGFYELAETKDMVAFLRAVSNPFDDLSLVRILQCPIVGLSDATLYAVCRRRSEAAPGIFDVLKDADGLTD
ncbi:MAG: hypothetical protein C4532_08355, partial [Candidatus Abyssobacteria bacterium SURF_17]